MELNKVLDTVLDQANQNKQSLQLPEGLKPLALRDSPSTKKRVGEALDMFYDALKTYGKSPDQLESVTKLFMFALADYDEKRIFDALAYYTKNYPEFPAPADIVQIIERGNKPPFSESVYVTKNKKYPEDRTDEDWQYLKDYERWIMKG